MRGSVHSSPMAGEVRPLPRAFYERPTEVAAFELIGKILVLKQERVVLSGRIVETEAYLGADDPASHAWRGPTPRNRVMFGPAGFSYVYFTYGVHHCFNVVTEREGVPGAVLIRALEPLSGIGLMRERRGGGRKDETLTNGPAKLTQAFHITRAHSGCDLTREPFFIGEENSFVSRNGGASILTIRVSPRVGISRAKDKLFRYYDASSLCVSAHPKG